MTKITVIKSINPNRVCKEYTKGDDGKIIKKVVANVTQGVAFTTPADTADEMVAILEQVTSRSDLVICSGQWKNDPGVQFEVLPEKELAQLMGSTIGAVDGGVLEKDGRYVSARVKRGITPSNWVLLDADNPPGIPAEWAAMSIAERLNLWEPLLPGISKCERIELRGSSARVINGSGSQKATHAWIRVSDAQKIALMKAHVGIEMVVQGVSFPFKKVSQTDPNKVVGIESRSVFDLAVFDTGRLVFTAAPQVNIPDYSVDDPGITIINPGCGPLDIDWITPPTKSIQKYRELTGIAMNIQLSNDGYVSVHNNGQLTYETEIAVKGVIKPLAAWLEKLKPGEKLRCESPFRESQSEAAFIKIGDDGKPFIYDVGNGTTYHLKLEDIAKKAVNPWMDRVISYADTLQAPAWLIDGFFSDKLTIIAGAPGVGKTSALVPMALLAAGFQSHLSHFVTCKYPRKVLYVTEDAQQVETMLYGVRKHMLNMATNDYISHAEMSERFKLVATRKSKPGELAMLLELCNQHKTSVTTPAGTFEMMPLLVLDTASSSFDIDDENNNSEVSKYLATIKEVFLAAGVPVWVVGHTAKSMKRADVSEFSARGAGSFEGDANCVAYLFQEDGLEDRFLRLGKHRYVAQYLEIKFDSCVHQETVINCYGDEEIIPYRYTSVDRSSEGERIAQKLAAKEESENEKLQKIKNRIYEAIQTLEVPSKTNVEKYKGYYLDNRKVVDEMLLTGELIRKDTGEKFSNKLPILVLEIGEGWQP